MVKFTRCDFAFMLYILISSFCEIIEYLCKFDGKTGILIIVFLLFLIPVFLGYAIFFLLEIINLIKSKSFDSVSAIFFYIACFLPILIFPNYPEWIHSNWALLVLLVRILVLLMFLLFRIDYFCIKILICTLVAIMEFFNMTFDFLLFDAIIGCLYIILIKYFFIKSYISYTDYKYSTSGTNNHSKLK